MSAKVSTNEYQATELTAPESLLNQLEALASLNDGWDSYRAKAPSPDAIRRAWSVVGDFVSYVVAAGARASVAPMLDGGVCVAFVRGPNDLEIRIPNSGRMVFVANDEDETTIDDPSVLKSTIAAFTARQK